MKIKTHIGYYLSLMVIFSLGICLILLFPDNKEMQMATVVLIATLYVVWGIVHHYVNHELAPKIVVEYILIGTLGMTIVLFLLKGGFGL